MYFTSKAFEEQYCQNHKKQKQNKLTKTPLSEL